MDADRALGRNERRLRAAVLTALAVMTVGKFVAATTLDLFADEAFYWQCAQRPALHYADHPFMTAILIRFGTAIFGDTTLGTRFFFLVAGALFPLVVYRLARPLVGEARAWLAAGSSLILPPTAHLGLVAVPDVPLLLLAALAFMGLERATRSDRIGPWILTATAIALGLSSHYRFILIPAGACLYLLTARAGRSQWRRPGPYILIGGLAAGLLPAMTHNLSNGFATFEYYLAGRHGAEVRPLAIVGHLAEQAAFVTPLLYLALVAVFVDLVRRALRRDDRARLLALLALPNLVVFLLASPFHDVSLLTMHWPAAGYIPLLVFLPATLSRLRRRSSSRAWKVVVALVPASGSPAVLLVIAALVATGHTYPGMLWELEGWSEVTAAVRSELAIETGAEYGELIVADNYKLGANLEFGLHGQGDVLILDHPINQHHGRASAFDDWGIGEEELANRAGEGALVIVQRDLGDVDRVAWMAHIRSHFEGLEPVDELRIGNGRRKTFLLLRGVVAGKELPP